MDSKSGFDYLLWFFIACLFYVYEVAEPVDSAVSESQVFDFAETVSFSDVWVYSVFGSCVLEKQSLFSFL